MITKRQKLKKQKIKLTIAQEKEKTNSNKFKSPVKKKSKCVGRSTRDKYKKRKKFILDNLNDNEKGQLR